MDNDFATGYALGSDSGNGNNSGFGGWGDGLWAIIILAMIWGGNGWGGFGGGSNSPGFQGYATRADVNEAIAFNGVEREVLVDGHPIEHLISYKIEENVDAPPTVTLKFDVIDDMRLNIIGRPNQVLKNVPK